MQKATVITVHLTYHRRLTSILIHHALADAESDCSHNAPAGNTYPANNLSPWVPSPSLWATAWDRRWTDLSTHRNSNNFNICVSAPTGTNWQRVEQSFAGATVYTFCDINCGGGESGAQITTCASPVAGCAIGSL